jgi:ABC-type transport system involved in multi-copper enzyme maturation permease subunit
MNLFRIWVIAHNVFRETLRDRVPYMVILYGLVMGGASLLLPQIANQAEGKIILDLGLGSLNFLGLIVAIFLSTNLINKEIEKRTVFVLIAKPMSRLEFIIGKHLGLSALLWVLTVMMTVLFLMAAFLQPSRALAADPIPVNALLVAIGFIFLEFVLMVAAGLLFGVFTSSILATLFTIALYLLGHFSPSLIRLSTLAEDKVLSTVFEAVYVILPNLERLNLKNEAVYAQLPAFSDLLTRGGYGLTYTLLLLTVTIIVFSRRQF